MSDEEKDNFIVECVNKFVMLTNRPLYVIGQLVGKLCTSLGLLIMDNEKQLCMN